MPIEFGPVNPISLVKRSNSNKSEKSSALTTKEICQLCGEDVLMVKKINMY